jgi:predicted transcriptional regulator of viral defense system
MCPLKRYTSSMAVVSRELTVADLAAAQWGLLTAAQAAQRGVTRLQLSRLAASGLLDRVAYGVYRLRGAAEDMHADLRAAWLSLNPARTAEQRLADPTHDVVISHASAAALHGLGDLNADQHELTAPVRRQTQRSEIRLHRGQLNRDDVTIVDGLPVTTATRTIVDLLADRHDTEHVATVLADAVRAGTVNLDTLPHRLAPYAARHGQHAGDGDGLLATLLEHAGLDTAALREQILASETGRQLANDIARASVAAALRALSDDLTAGMSPETITKLTQAAAPSSKAALMATEGRALINALGGPVGQDAITAQLRPVLDAIAAAQRSSPAMEHVRAQLAAAIRTLNASTGGAQLAQRLEALHEEPASDGDGDERNA